MAWTRPTLSQLQARGRDDLNARLPGADSRLRRSVLGALVTVFMGAVHGLYGYLQYLAQQILPDTAEGFWLRRWAAIYGLTPKAATVGVGAATVTGVDGSPLPAGTVLQRNDEVEYVTTATVTIVGGMAVAPIAASVAGSGGAAVAGVVLALVSPVAGINSGCSITTAVTGAADEESDEALRTRLLERIRQAPNGGSKADYKRWAKEVTEVTRAWVFPGWAGAGSVGVAFAMDGREDPIPLPADVTTVEAHIDLVRPVTADVIVFAPGRYALDLTIAGLSPDDEAVQDAVKAEIDDLLFREAEPGGTILLSHIREAISSAAGEVDHVLVHPSADIVAPAGQLAVRGVITWS